MKTGCVDIHEVHQAASTSHRAESRDHAQPSHQRDSRQSPHVGLAHFKRRRVGRGCLHVKRTPFFQAFRVTFLKSAFPLIRRCQINTVVAKSQIGYLHVVGELSLNVTFEC